MNARAALGKGGSETIAAVGTSVSNTADTAAELSPGHVVGLDGELHPGQLRDKHIRSALQARAHEIRHSTGYGVLRISRVLAADGHKISPSTIHSWLHQPCEVCNGDTLNPADFSRGGTWTR